MTDVRQMLQGKSSQIYAVAPNATVFEALQLMAKNDIGAVIVVEGEKVVGIFSERDYARKVVLRGRASKTSAVREMMSTAVYYAPPTYTVEQCLALMTQRHIRHLPVLDNGKLIGLVSIGDAVKALIAGQQLLIEQLENYITGDYT